MNEALTALAAAAGVETSYVDSRGKRAEAREGALIAVLSALGVPIRHRDEATAALAEWRDSRWNEVVAPVGICWSGIGGGLTVRIPTPDRPISGELLLEGGGRRTLSIDARYSAIHATAERRGRVHVALDLPLPADLPLGRHTLLLDVNRRPLGESTVICAPPTAWDPGPERVFGAFMPLYATRSPTTHGVGHLGSFGELARGLAERGASFVGTLPLLAAWLDQPFEPSPYSPVSRQFFNELFLDLTAQPESTALPQRAIDVAQHAAAESGGLIDYAAAAAHQHQRLALLAELAHKAGPRREAMEAWLAEDPLRDDYARFRGTAAHFKKPFWQWPDVLRDGGISQTAFDPAAYRMHRYAQFALHEQLTTLSADLEKRGSALYLDLPLGVHPDGYDTWRFRDAWSFEASAGAPPDPLFKGGQDWGFPPLHPERSRASGHAVLTAAVRTHLRYARRLRIDHVMALHRLYWVPRGFTAKDGVYVRYPAKEWLAVLCLESHRAGARLVGENLGTVPPVVEEALTQHHLRGMWIGQFALTGKVDAPLEKPQPDRLAALNTHDTPTYAGFCAGDDLELQKQMGLVDERKYRADLTWRVRAVDALRRFAHEKFGEGRGAEAMRVADALYRWLAEGESEVVLVNLEDLWGERRFHNVPGTHRERPNWRARSPKSSEQILDDAHIEAFLRAMRTARPKP